MRDVEPVIWILGLLGRTISAGEFVLNLQEWDKTALVMETFHETYDVYLTPTTAMPLSKIGELESKLGEKIAMQIVSHLGLGKTLLVSGLVDERMNSWKKVFLELLLLNSLILQVNLLFQFL